MGIYETFELLAQMGGPPPGAFYTGGIASFECPADASTITECQIELRDLSPGDFEDCVPPAVQCCKSFKEELK